MIADAGDWLRDIIEEHVEELPALWRRRSRAWRSPGFSLRALQQLDARLEAHTDALVLAGEDAMPLVETLLGSEDSNEVLTAAHAMLRLEDGVRFQQVKAAFEQAPPDVLQGFALAFAYSRANLGLDSGPTPLHTLALLYAQALQGKSINLESALDLLVHEKTAVRERAWHSVAMLNPKRRIDLRRAVTTSMKDEPSVRRAALVAAAWTRQSWLLDELRRLTDTRETVRRDALELLAVIGQPEDVFRIRAAVSDTTLGPNRFELIGQFGHPALLEALIPVMEDGNPLEASSAGLAFQRITGVSVNSDQRIEIEEDSIPIPDARLARTRWFELKNMLSGAMRWAYGVNVEHGLSATSLAAIDLPSLAEGRLRDAFHGRFNDGPGTFEAFPYR